MFFPSLAKLIDQSDCQYEIVREYIRNHSRQVNLRDKFGRTPLHRATSHGRTDIANVLLAWGADLHISDNFGDTPLHSAVRHGQKETVVLLLQNNALIDAKSSLGKTPLHLAACITDESVSSEIVKLLLDHGAFKGARDLSGKMPYDYAELYQNNHLLNILR